MNTQNPEILEKNGCPDSFATTSEAKGPIEQSVSRSIQIDIPISEPASPSQADYVVGYGRPPEANKFKKGQSGNPLGRPKANPSVWDEIEDVLKERVTVTVQGQPQSLSLVAAIFLKQCEMALNGNHRSTEAVFKKAKDFGVLEKPSKWDEWVETILHKPEDDD